LRVTFEQAFIDRAFDVDAEPQPSLAIDQSDEAPQFRRVLDLVLRFEKNRADDAGATRQRFKDCRIAPRQFLALQVAQDRPAAIFGDRGAVLDAVGGQPHALVVHFERYEICEM